ncbi:hypothetical protein Zmor_017740 [Zophobas morio]|uniref:Uncharacterized protein n=1 Tax=Zophobas morio TaxID=2755281 RepID=A0AA38I8Z0_9CUCU|nr:hypothetical protein Zmor_017740 [Zophobas morio]
MFVAVVAPKEYCKLKNKFWIASKKSPTSALADLQLKTRTDFFTALHEKPRRAKKQTILLKCEEADNREVPKSSIGENKISTYSPYV